LLVLKNVATSFWRLAGFSFSMLFCVFNMIFVDSPWTIVDSFLYFFIRNSAFGVRNFLLLAAGSWLLAGFCCCRIFCVLKLIFVDSPWTIVDSFIPSTFEIQHSVFGIFLVSRLSALASKTIFQITNHPVKKNLSRF